MIDLIACLMMSVRIIHIDVNQKPTFSYMVVSMSSSAFNYEYGVTGGVLFVLIKPAEVPRTREVNWEKDRFFKKAVFSEVVEGGKRHTLMFVHLRRYDLKWSVSRSENSILIFAGTSIPFTGKADLEEYMRTSLETRNYGAIDIFFDLIESEDKEMSAKASFYLAELLFRMGLETREVATLLKSANFYSGAGKAFFDLGNIEAAAESKYRASVVFRMCGFYPESKFQADVGLAYVRKIGTPVSKDLVTKLSCSKILSLVGMGKAGEAAIVVDNMRTEVPKSVDDETHNCYWSALGVIEFEKGNFDKAAEHISYVADRFIQNDPVVLPRYIRSLMRTNRSYLAKRYVGYMLNSILPELRPEAMLLLSEVLLMDGDDRNSLRSIYRVLREYPGTRWEVRARLFALINIQRYSEAVKTIPRSDVPRDDPVMFPLANMRFIILSFISPESQLAFREYLRYILKRIDGADADELEGELLFIRNVAPMMRALRTPPDLREEISDAMYEISKTLYEKGYKIRAFAFYAENRGLFPPRYARDYSFVDELLKELEGKDEKSYELARIEVLTSEGKCDEAYGVVRKLSNKLTQDERSSAVFRVIACFAVKGDEKFREICKLENVQDVESICVLKEADHIKRIELLKKEILESHRQLMSEIEGTRTY